MKLFTIGFAKRTAEGFFRALEKAGVRRLVDVRLHNTSQLAGFTKRDDLAFFTRAICGASYEHRLDLAPTEEIFEIMKKGAGSFEDGAAAYRRLIARRKVETLLKRDDMDGACLLCSEEKPHRCHRRLLAEYLAEKWPKVEIVHLELRPRAGAAHAQVARQSSPLTAASSSARAPGRGRSTTASASATPGRS